MNTYTSEEIAALEILRGTGVNIVEATLVARAALEAGRYKVKRTLKCVALGAEELKRQEKTVSFEKAVEEALAARKDLRARTKCDYRYVLKRFMRRCEGLAQRRMRSIRTEECAAYIEQAFSTPSQRAKARRILSAVFGTAVKRGWCSENPVSKVDVPVVKEQRIRVLSPEEIEQLLSTARSYEGGSCLAAVGMMLYAGIRPHEVARLTWEQVDLKGGTISILPQHSKTGGARLVTIHKPLACLLAQFRKAKEARICPTRWVKHWHDLRHHAGWNNGTHRWQQDALRHTFASYHLRHFRSYSELQYEIGHRDTYLLRTRYVDMSGVRSTKRFWL